MQEISPKDANEKIKSGAGVLDVRTPAEYQNGHIKGSVNLNIADPNVLENFMKLPQDKEYVVYCQSGGRSSSASKMLSALGFGKVCNLSGGITAWAGEGLPVEK